MPTIEVYLRELAVWAAPAVIAPAELAARTLTRRRRRLRWKIGSGAAVVVVATGAVAGARLGHTGPYFQTFEPSASMAPTVAVGESVVANRRLDPQHGDVVVVRLTEQGRTDEVIERLIAVGGDTLSCPDGGSGRCEGLQLNGRVLSESYLTSAVEDPFAAITVPVGTVFIAGDDRAVSRDSRQYGPIPLTAVEGVVVRIVASNGTVRPVPGAPAHPGGTGSVDPLGPVPPAVVSTPGPG